MPAMHVREEDLELYLHGQLTPEQVSNLRSHLEQCERCKDELRKTEAFLSQFVDLSKVRSQAANDERRRAAPRYLLDEAASMTQLKPLVPGRSEVRVIDVSRGGLRIIVPAALEVGAIVQIRMKPIIVTGEVRHCTLVGESFQVGLQIHDLFPTKRVGG